AIAIRYKQGEDVAPKVVAKGADALALRIVEVAKASNVFTVENKPLAHGLYDAVELDQFIPVEFYTAIAELLAQVYKMREAEKHRGY
ncbi:MAG: EscU/YscU/HrcU family type III secretion system export apparatus switch protein, partial [Oscillospiraceae bacterium]